jgi:hypothetical protein
MDVAVFSCRLIATLFLAASVGIVFFFKNLSRIYKKEQRRAFVAAFGWRG